MTMILLDRALELGRREEAGGLLETSHFRDISRQIA